MNGILLVDDDKVDAMAVRRALRDLRIEDALEVAGDGQEALAVLNQSRGGPPRFILLDLNMPRMGGLEFLRTLKRDDSLRSIPVVVLSSSDAEEDRVQSLELGADEYVVKSFDYGDFMERVKMIFGRWSDGSPPGRGASGTEEGENVNRSR
jgi:CheY-like chemotaxis protein